jgi:hypothetical protein
MSFSKIPELDFHGVWDRGVPGRERISFEVDQPYWLGDLGLICGPLDEYRSVIPSANYFYKFPNRIVEPPTWVILYTGPGQIRETTLVDQVTPALVLHWGQPVVFHGTRAAWEPVLLRIAQVSIP